MSKDELVKWINNLLLNNKLIIFYNTKLWKNLKREVLREQHFECQECLKKGDRKSVV